MPCVNSMWWRVCCWGSFIKHLLTSGDWPTFNKKCKPKQRTVNIKDHIVEWLRWKEEILGVLGDDDVDGLQFPIEKFFPGVCVFLCLHRFPPTIEKHVRSIDLYPTWVLMYVVPSMQLEWCKHWMYVVKFFKVYYWALVQKSVKRCTFMYSKITDSQLN